MRATPTFALRSVLVALVACGSDNKMMEPQPGPFPGPPVTTLVENLSASTGGVSVGPDGNIYVADAGPLPNRGGNTVFRITPVGDVSVFASGPPLNSALGGAWRSDGLFHQASLDGNSISQIAADGTITTFVTAGIVGPVGLVFDGDDNLYVANCGNGSIRRVTPDGTSEQLILSPLLNCPNGITFGPGGDLYIANFNDGNIVRVTLAGAASVFATLPIGNLGHITFGDEVFYVAARGNHRIYTVSTTGDIDVLVGSGAQGFSDGEGGAATLSLPNGLALSADGNTLYFNQVRSTTGTQNNPSQLRAIDLSREN